ncbi:DUF281 domain-containing protein [Caenorhabditis elegans]|uniref:DUF281 domain-containing protein n=1 Tax=Caenorhabditis elegans TaxID=6239 RepID=Q9GYM0_CAEEL|nr:DUF281 domain-containing protein [Caenorhabditis elegans]CCD70302.1 DUF281 domain-containing protein [Caenorhabditis elegans]|eukprot:NP_494732.1 Uncharacterized protein CELE_R03H10.5 [Caenorhabditis elegans]
MNNFFLFVVLIGLFHCEAGCYDSCPCPDMLDTLIESPETTLYSEGAGCIRNVTCQVDSYPVIHFMWTESEIPKPDEADDDYFLATVPAPGIIEYIDMFSYFGVVCENDGWYATKYPNGVYYEYGLGFRTIGPDEVEGKRSKIVLISW